jgi:glutamyl/glutaminyl-tRNA synthetase
MANSGGIASPYRGRLAPSPTGLLHLGHFNTFRIAAQRAREAAGRLVMRIEDLDQARCRPEFESMMLEDLRWAGLDWHEGPDCGGPHAPYRQSERLLFYKAAWQRMKSAGLIYPCSCTRRDVVQAAGAPHGEDGEPIYSGACRERHAAMSEADAVGCNWRFRVPDGQAIRFEDALQGSQRFVAGVDFGDFLVWRKDGIPSYELAVVVDDAAMEITEVVRGADLLKSTARQLLLYRALGLKEPSFCHADLVLDADGRRLAKRDGALGLRNLRERGARPEELPQLARPPPAPAKPREI